MIRSIVAWVAAHPESALEWWVLASVFFSALKPKNEDQFDKYAKVITPAGARLLVALAAFFTDFLKVFQQLLGIAARQNWSASAQRALRSIPPSPNDPPPVSVEGEDPKK